MRQFLASVPQALSFCLLYRTYFSFVVWFVAAAGAAAGLFYEGQSKQASKFATVGIEENRTFSC